MLDAFRTRLHDRATKLTDNVAREFEAIAHRAQEVGVAQGEHEARDLRLAATVGGAPAPVGASQSPDGGETEFCASCHKEAVPVAGWWCFGCHVAFARGSEQTAEKHTRAA